MSTRSNRQHRLDSRRDWVRTLPIGVCSATGKKMFTSKADAKQTARRFCNDQRPFPCDHCGYWHLGHQIGKPREWHRNLHRQQPAEAQETGKARRD